jgi:hypothetical protein
MTDEEALELALVTLERDNLKVGNIYVNYDIQKALIKLVKKTLRGERKKKEWQGLTDEEMLNAYAPNRIPDSAYSNMGEDLKKIHDATKEEMLSGLRAIEAKLREKNSG